eukprot:UN23610
MQLVDNILAMIDNPNDGLGPNWNAAERIAHKFHMEDLWLKLSKIYKFTPKPSPEVCECLYDDFETNGIYDSVMWVAEHYDVGTPITLLGRPIPKLVDGESWVVWKD